MRARQRREAAHRGAGAVAIVGPWLLPASSLVVLRLLLAFAGSVAVGRFMWTEGHERIGGVIKAAVIGGIVVGGVGFIAGFVGPIILRPGANQGPLLGIFVTGPIGFVVGLICGGAYWMSRRARRD